MKYKQIKYKMKNDIFLREHYCNLSVILSISGHFSWEEVRLKFNIQRIWVLSIFVWSGMKSMLIICQQWDC